MKQEESDQKQIFEIAYNGMSFTTNKPEILLEKFKERTDPSFLKIGESSYFAFTGCVFTRTK